jgi:hypothetical protein
MSNIQKRLEINELLRIYGALLTSRQREIISRRYTDDLSFGEIAVEFDITRQAVLNFENKGIRLLHKYEKQLGVYDREQKIKSLLEKTFVDEHARRALYEVFS